MQQSDLSMATTLPPQQQRLSGTFLSSDASGAGCYGNIRASQLHPSGALKQPVSRLPCPGLLAHTSRTTVLNDSLRACVSAMPQDAQRHLGSAGISLAAEAAASQREDLSRAVVSSGAASGPAPRPPAAHLCGLC